MAKIGKPRLAKKPLKASPKNIRAKKPSSKPVLKAVSSAPAKAGAKSAPAQASSPAADAKRPAQGASLNGEKKVSQKLIETIEKRKSQQGKAGMLFARPPGRRGRRPKGMAEYTPEHQEDETYMEQADNTSLEYEAGIRVKSSRDENSFNLDRFEDYDEELNFDW